jgi:FecR protein
MKARVVLAIVAVLAAAYSFSLPSSADGPKELQNKKGDVSYQIPDKAAQPLAPNASIALTDSDFTITGDNSLAVLTLPDSSVVQMGSNTKVQLQFFNQTNIATAKFVAYGGKIRFTVEHPQGAKADYTFTTPTGNVAVRGTQGDLAVDSQGNMTVNVYALGNPDLPVQVTTKDGAQFYVKQGQSLATSYVKGIVQAQVSQLTKGMVDAFAPDFGLPSNWDQLKGEIIQQVQNRVPLPPVPLPPGLP